MKTSRIILLIIIGLLLIGGGIGFYLFNKPPATVEKQKAVATVNAQTLYNEYSSDENTANSKYLGKIVEVSGKIAGINMNENGEPVFQLNNALFGVSCSFDPFFLQENSTLINSLNKGEQVTVKCKCDGMLTDVVLSRCILLYPNK